MKIHLILAGGIRFKTKCGRYGDLTAAPATDMGRVFTARPPRGAELKVARDRSVVTCGGCKK